MIRHDHRAHRQVPSHVLRRSHRSQPHRSRWLRFAHRSQLSLIGMKVHRAIVLVVMMLLAIGAFVLLVMDSAGKSLIALGVVVIAAAAGGIGFSWKRYFRR